MISLFGKIILMALDMDKDSLIWTTKLPQMISSYNSRILTIQDEKGFGV